MDNGFFKDIKQLLETGLSLNLASAVLPGYGSYLFNYAKYICFLLLAIMHTIVLHSHVILLGVIDH